MFAQTFFLKTQFSILCGLTKSMQNPYGSLHQNTMEGLVKQFAGPHL